MFSASSWGVVGFGSRRGCAAGLSLKISAEAGASANTETGSGVEDTGALWSLSWMSVCRSQLAWGSEVDAGSGTVSDSGSGFVSSTSASREFTVWEKKKFTYKTKKKRPKHVQPKTMFIRQTVFLIPTPVCLLVITTPHPLLTVSSLMNNIMNLCKLKW